MKTQLKINGEMKDVEIENGEITIIEPKKKTGWEKTKPLKYYYGGHATGDFAQITYDLSNYSSNKKLAENIIKAQALQRKFWRWQAENDVPTTDDIWTIYYDSLYHCLTTLSNVSYREVSYREWGLPYFSSNEKAKEFIKTYKDDLIWLFTEFKWRMDG